MSYSPAPMLSRQTHIVLQNDRLQSDLWIPKMGQHNFSPTTETGFRATHSNKILCIHLAGFRKVFWPYLIGCLILNQNFKFRRLSGKDQQQKRSLGIFYEEPEAEAAPTVSREGCVAVLELVFQDKHESEVWLQQDATPVHTSSDGHEIREFKFLKPILLQQSLFSLRYN